MNTIRTLGDLKKALSVYDDGLPVEFRSLGPGGTWPRHNEAMYVTVDDQIGRREPLDGDAKLVVWLGDG